ncbi:MAG: hypothetical protein ACFCU6_00265 [Balneolaceae bacterium]
MLKKNTTVIFSILLLISFRSYGQTIHKNDIYDFTAILITTPHQQPEKWPDGKDFEKYVSLRDSFYLHTTTPNPSSEIFFQPFPNWHDSISIKTTVFVPPHTQKGFQLDIPEKEWRLIMLNNGGYESSTNYFDGGTRRLLLHEFLDERTLLVIMNTFNLTRKEGVHNRGFTYTYYDYELNDIKSELINLEEQLKIVNN